MAYRPSSDRVLFFTTSLLTVFGLIMVYSASSVVATTRHGMSYYYFVRQIAFAGAGYVAMLLLLNIDYRVWRKERVLKIIMLVTLVLLVLVFTQPRINGAHRWLRYGPVLSFQPSEIAKLVLLMFLAAYLHKHGPDINRLWGKLVPCLFVVGGFAALVGLEPDLGQAVCIVVFAAILLFTAGLSWKYYAAAATLVAPAFYLAVYRVPYRWERVKAFLDPFADPLGSGWQIAMSLTAVGSGGMGGLGLGQSKQKMFFLPEAPSDFIFAIIGEELGLVGTALLVLAFLLFFWRGLRIALRAPDGFGFYLAFGITLMIAVQALINMSMVLAMIPTKGIALPFISQGGSSLLLNLTAAGILLNISHYAGTGSTSEAE